MLGDVGGLLDGLTVIGSFFMTIYSFIVKDPLEAYLFSSLFKTEPKLNNQIPVTASQKLKRIKER